MLSPSSHDYPHSLVSNFSSASFCDAYAFALYHLSDPYFNSLGLSTSDRNLLSSCRRSCYSFTFISIIAYSRVRHISSVYIHHTPSGVITILRNVSPHRSRLACAFPSRSVGMPKPRHWQHPYISTSYYRDPRHPTLSTPFPHSWSAHSLFITLSTRVPVFSRNHLLCPLELALLQSTHTHTEAGFAARHSV